MTTEKLFDEPAENMDHEDVIKQITAIDWMQYETAYGCAGDRMRFPFSDGTTYHTVGESLCALFSGDEKSAMRATHELWCGLCHQHAYLSSAALPAYEFLLRGLLELSDKLKVELLDIFTGFAYCSGGELNPERFQYKIREKLMRDIEIFRFFVSSDNEDIAGFASMIVEELDK